MKESYQKQKQFITDASHERKTPLTIIEVNTQVLEMEQGENEWLKSTHNQIERMSHLVQQMVSLTRMDEERGKGEKCEFSLSDASRNSETGGSGIGLSIARAICENHGGNIQAESKDGHSLTVTVVL